MTKPLVSLAAMMLVEEDRIPLSAPVSQYLPVLRDLKVGAPGSDGSMELVPCRREPTVLDLLRHTSGFYSALFVTPTVRQLYKDAALNAFRGNADEYLAKLALLPLQFQPGTEWNYGRSTTVLGHIVEAVSGLDLDAFVAQRITTPLRMPDTGFWVEGAQHGRIAEPQMDLQKGARPPFAVVTERPIRFDGSGQMVSTAADYARFCQFILNGGALDGERLVSRKTVELMTSDQLPPDISVNHELAAIFGGLLPTSALGSGFGLGFAVRTRTGGPPWSGTVGDLHWFGDPSGCNFFIDPREELFAILMMQAPGQMIQNLYQLRALVYRALVD